MTLMRAVPSAIERSRVAVLGAAARVFRIVAAGLVCAALSAGAHATVTLTKVTSNATPTAGGAAFSYTITVTNDAGAVPDVVVTDPLPPGVIFQNAAVVGAGMTCVGPPVGTNGAVTCASSLLPAVSSYTITIVAQIVPNVAGGVRTNTAYLRYPGASLSASVQQVIQVDAPLSIAKSAPANGVAGDTIVYNLLVLNGGSSSALNVTVTDVLPPKMSFQSVFATRGFRDGCHFDPVLNALLCSASVLDTGSHDITLVLKASPSLTGVVTNTATLATGTGTIAVGSSSSNTNFPVVPVR
ncbi:MAG: hypothetical protein U1F15_05065 [Burkholderiales bacterium]